MAIQNAFVDYTYQTVPIDAKTIGNTDISNTLSEPVNIISSVVIVNKEVIGGLTPPVINIGTNSPNYNNILSAQVVLPLDGDVQVIPISPLPLPSGLPIKCRVAVAAIASTFDIQVLVGKLAVQ